MKCAVLCVIVSSALLSASPAVAQIDAPVPTNNYITFGGSDWAWAAPCAPMEPSCGVVDFSYQGTQGWRLPTADEFLAGPLAADFGTYDNFRCASAWFSTNYTHCDYGDGVQFAVYGDPRNPYPGNGAVETWAIRNAAAVPEPTTWAMMLFGFVAISVAMRRRRKKSWRKSLERNCRRCSRYARRNRLGVAPEPLRSRLGGGPLSQRASFHFNVSFPPIPATSGVSTIDPLRTLVGELNDSLSALCADRAMRQRSTAASAAHVTRDPRHTEQRHIPDDVAGARCLPSAQSYIRVRTLHGGRR